MSLKAASILLFLSSLFAINVVVHSQNDKFPDEDEDGALFGGNLLKNSVVPGGATLDTQTQEPTDLMTHPPTTVFNGTTLEPYVDNAEASAYLLNGSTIVNVINDLASEEFDKLGLRSFREALMAAEMFDQLLDSASESEKFTVFAPTNDAMKKNPHIQLYIKGKDETPRSRWYGNLRAALMFHIVPNNTLHTTDIFNATSNITEIETMLFNNSVTVARVSQKIHGASFVQRNIEALNGVIHVIDHVLQPKFMTEPFGSLELQPEYGPDVLERTSLVTVVEVADPSRQTLDQVVETGLTFAGCRIRAFNRLEEYLPQTINYSRNVTVGEFLNHSFATETRTNLFEYSLIPKNYYFDEIKDGFHELVMPLSKKCSAHMWVTKRNGVLCFNNGCTIETPDLRTYLASNGVGYVVDKCQVCMGIAMLAGVATDYTMYNMRDTHQFLVASLWNLRDLRQSVGNGKSDVTLFASNNDGWGFFNLEDVTRLAGDEWHPHKLDLLRHFLVQGRYGYADLMAKYKADGPFNLTSLAGEPLMIAYDADYSSLTVAGGTFVVKDIRGVDGLMHFTNQVPLPRSMTQTVYDYAKELPQFSTQIELIDQVQLAADMKRLLPLTAFYVPNDQWENKKIELEDIAKSVLENHIFKKLLWCKTLRGMAGQYAESHNEKYWNITVNETTNMPCLEYSDNSKTYKKMRSCITKCDILVRNGIVHEVDTLILFEDPETLPPREEGMRLPGMDGDKYEELLKQNFNKTATSTGDDTTGGGFITDKEEDDDESQAQDSDAEKSNGAIIRIPASTTAHLVVCGILFFTAVLVL